MATSSATAAPDTRHSRSSRSSLRRSLGKQLPSYLFILPALILYVIFVLIPFFNTIYYSMTDWDGAQPVKNFIGPANFIRMFQDRLMWLSLSHNLIWIAVGTLTPVVFALITATLVSGGMRGRVVFRTIYFRPVVLAQETALPIHQMHVDAIVHLGDLLCLPIQGQLQDVLPCFLPLLQVVAWQSNAGAKTEIGNAGRRRRR